MEATLYSNIPEFRSRLSFVPFIKSLETLTASGDYQFQLCQDLVREFHSVPELMEAIDDYEVLKKRQELIEKAIAAIFPLISQVKNQFTAISTPFSNKVIHASAAFRKSFVDDRNNYLLPLDSKVAKNIMQGRIELAYKMVLKEFYGIDIGGGNSFICAYPDKSEDRSHYFEMMWDHQFILVTPCIPLPVLPGDFSIRCNHVRDLPLFPVLRQLLPLEEFIFEGIMLMKIREVTEREATDHIREILAEEDCMDSIETLTALRNQLEYLLQTEIREVGISSLKDYAIKDVIITQRFGRLFGKMGSIKEWQKVTGFLEERLKDSGFYAFGSKEKDHLFAGIFGKDFNDHVLFIPLYDQGSVSGCLELYTSQPLHNVHKLISRLKAVIPYMEAALQREERRFRDRVDKLVKDHFTAIQPSVEWRFHQSAVKYLVESQKSENPKMDPVVFTDVHPLYGAIDIRNSSSERNNAAQQDLMRQLLWAKGILLKAKEWQLFPMLEEVLSEVDENIRLVQNHLISTDEQSLHILLKNEMPELLDQLGQMIPALKEEIDRYLQALDPASGILNERQKHFEETISTINHFLSEFVDREQGHAQKLFPHYFERFVTDGVDLNMYIGQSISPEKRFSMLLLKNLRLWQLRTIVMAARQYRDIVLPNLALPLETTQLILAYGQPIFIRFRTAERKFDVDSTSTRYEIVKKRIDKAYIKKTNERLTKPGTIAIAYFNEKDAAEFSRHISFLKKENLLEGPVEKLELEELQGVIGLKALRVALARDPAAANPGNMEAKSEIKKN